MGHHHHHRHHLIDELRATEAITGFFHRKPSPKEVNQMQKHELDLGVRELETLDAAWVIIIPIIIIIT
jgi:hypothetical protein